MRDLAQDALELVEQGWHIFPLHTWDVDHCDCRKDCHSPAKHPRTQHGLKDASPHKADVIRWWGQWPQANIGVRTGMESGLVVVDIDPRNGGTETWLAMREEHRYEHLGPACVTGGGGLHLYFRHPEDGKPVLSRSGQLGAGVDVKADGGYVVCPPSTHARGTSYAWVEGYAPWERGTPGLPDWLLASMRGPEDGAVKSAAPVAERISEGMRRSALLSLAGSMRHRNMGETAIFNALMAENAEKCEPPLDAREVAKLAADAVARWQPGMAFIVPSKVNKETAKQRYVPQPFTLAELEHEELPEVRWAVPGLLPEGLALLAGKPKIGKSWMAHGLVVDMARGVDTLGELPTMEGDCLYLALEDTKRRMKARTKRLVPAGGWPGRAWCEVGWPRMDEGGLEAVEAWLGQHPQARLVVIDTLQKLKAEDGGRGSKADIYAADYAAISAVKQVADRYGVCILLITHLNKSDHDDELNKITGSTGITGAADTILMLNRPREQEGQEAAVLFVTGRDVEERSWAVRFDREAGRWSLLGDLVDVRQAREYDEVRKTLRVMWLDGMREVTPAAYAKFTGKRVNTATQALLRASREDFIDRVTQGKYMLKQDDQPSPGAVLSDRYAPPRQFRMRPASDIADGEKGDA